MSDTIHNLNVVREALEAEGLAVHVNLIDQAIEDIRAAPQAEREPVAYRWRAHGAITWIYDPTSEWLDEHRDEVEHEALYVATPSHTQAGSAPQAVQLPPIPIHWARPKGDTFDEMRDNVWKTGLATGGDTILIWVNEGDFLHAQIVFGAVEYPQFPHNIQAGSEISDEALNSYLRSTGEWIETFTAERESGVAVECDMSQEDADAFNAEARNNLRKIYADLGALSRPPCGPTEKTEGDQS